MTSGNHVALEMAAAPTEADVTVISGGQQLTDYWFYVHHRWVFDLVLSNPDEVKLYQMPAAQYIAAIGCAH
jgi:hypothetical protein